MTSLINLINSIGEYRPTNRFNNTNCTNFLTSIVRSTFYAGVFGVVLSGCTLSNSLSSVEDETSIVSSSLNESVKPEGLSEEDAEKIKNAVVQVDDLQNSNLTAWSNPQSGNTGTITAIDDYIGTHGQSCKKFRTTVDSFMGIALYNGETCELKKGFWVLSWFIRDTAK
ncbi:MAG: RT0821/Lpp0805 family surface protein [Nitratireductor sp.]